MLDIQDKLVEQTKKVLQDLYETGENFYFIVFTITGEGIIPTLSAWSHEALQNKVKNHEISLEEINNYKWSYSDSPYCDFGAEYYYDLRKYFQTRGDLLNMDVEKGQSEYNFRLELLTKTMEILDSQGLFSIKNNRNSIMINVEEIPPTAENTERALKLNPIKSIEEWIEYCAE